MVSEFLVFSSSNESEKSMSILYGKTQDKILISKVIKYKLK